MTRTVTLKWNAVKDRWDMSFEGHFIMDFPNCKNMKLFFRPNKDKVNTYEIGIRKVEKV